MELIALVAPLLQGYTTIVMAGFWLAELVTGLPGSQVMDAWAVSTGTPNPESAGVGDVLTHTLSS